MLVPTASPRPPAARLEAWTPPGKATTVATGTALGQHAAPMVTATGGVE